MPKDIYAPPANFGEAELRLKLAREQYFTALAINETKVSIKALWKRIEPLLAGPDKSKAFGILSIALATIWKNGYEARRDPLLCQHSGQDNCPNLSSVCSDLSPEGAMPSTSTDAKEA